MPGKKVVLPVRCRRYGVGKEIGGAVYMHKSYAHLLGERIEAAKARIPQGFCYSVVKFMPATKAVSFIASPDFDVTPEPTVGDLWTVSADGPAKLRKRLADPFIYHHKWLFVADDYAGFDVLESKERSLMWLSLPTIDFQQIGRRSYWIDAVLPRLTVIGSEL